MLSDTFLSDFLNKLHIKINDKLVLNVVLFSFVVHLY